ncbi:Uncharacterized protein Adt_46410 [Abeliophyllum distichum]|uniref:Uncharacterized protein n=1 Tax=Abeliophyllum distichum TaxID=126358 RepID=A0ABD1P0D0_9LAMI
MVDPNASHTTKVVDHKKSTKQHLDVLNGQFPRLCDAVKTNEEKVEIAEMDICKLNIQLDDSRMICTAMTNGVAIFSNLREEMETMSLQLQTLQCVVGNGQAPA